MRGVYTSDYDCSGVVSGPKTLLVVQAPSNGVLEIFSAKITSLDASTAEQWQGGLYRINSMTPSSAFQGSANLQKHELLDGSTVAASSGYILGPEPTYNPNPIDRQGFNNFGGYMYDPIPEERPVVKPGEYIGLRLTNATITSGHVNAEITYREIG
jgi:hypothetical protein